MKEITTTNCMLVDLTISRWTGRRKDKEASAEVNHNHGTRNAGNFWKVLLNKEQLAPITRKANQITAIRDKYCLSWQVGGFKLLPCTVHMSFVGEMNKAKAEFYDAVNEFCQNYEDAKAEAKLKLKSLYKESDYPTSEEIKGKFRVHVGLQPMPNNMMLPVGATDAETEKIREDIEAETNRRYASAIEDAYGRAKDAISRAIETLDEYGKREKGGGPKRRVYGSTFDTIKELTELLPAFNVVGDPKLAKLANDMKSLIADPANLKKDSTARDKYIAKAKMLEDLYF